MMIMVAAFAVSSLIVFAMLRFGFHGELDHPNSRSLHAVPIPRSGGIAILMAAGIGAYAAPDLRPIFIVAAVVALVSWVDDQWRGLPVWVRLVVHVGAALALVILARIPSMLAYTSIFLIFAATVWATNLYNFMDGADGLAGGMAAIGFGSYAIAAMQGGDAELATLSGCIAAGALGFLPFNFYPARIFLGDIGSIPLGFFSAALGVEGVLRELWPVWFPGLVFSPFIVDATVTLVRRALRGERVWHAHREHYYQRMVQSGLGHRTTALLWYIVMLAAGGSALLLLHVETLAVGIALCIWAVAYVTLALVVDRRWKRFQSVGVSL